MKKRYISPELDVFFLDSSLSILHALSAYGTVEDYGDGGDLGDTQDGLGDFFDF